MLRGAVLNSSNNKIALQKPRGKVSLADTEPERANLTTVGNSSDVYKYTVENAAVQKNFPIIVIAITAFG